MLTLKRPKSTRTDRINRMLEIDQIKHRKEWWKYADPRTTEELNEFLREESAAMMAVEPDDDEDDEDDSDLYDSEID